MFESAITRKIAGSGLGRSTERYAGRNPEQLETFLARAQARERPVPRFVERELRAFLRCAIPAFGFLRVHCDPCGPDRVVAFSAAPWAGRRAEVFA